MTRDHVAPKIGTLPNYRRALAQGYSPESQGIHQVCATGDWDAAISEVTDELVSEFGVAGNTETIRNQVREIANHPVGKTPIISVSRSVPPQVRDRTIEELQPGRL